jgi:hypothetical protein
MPRRRDRPTLPAPRRDATYVACTTPTSRHQALALEMAERNHKSMHLSYESSSAEITFASSMTALAAVVGELTVVTLVAVLKP